jgi:lipoprotein-releasing system ATP-binding protein
MTLTAQDLWKSYEDPHVDILRGISLKVEPGESVAICGRSGEGKTTLLHLLGGLENPSRGIVRIGDELLYKGASSLRNLKIGFVFQSFHLLDDCTALENVLMPSRIARRPLDIAHGLELLRRVGLESRAHFPAHLLSGGEKQRVAFARALCNDPDFILADEPSGNLDRGHAQRIGELLLECTCRKKGLILVTHDPELAALCQRRYTLQNGVLL